VDKSWQEPNEILTLFAFDEYKHGSIYAEVFHFLRDFTIIDIVSEKSLSAQRHPFPLNLPTRILDL